MDNLAIELEDLERVFRDERAEPIKLSYGLLRSVTENFSTKIGHGGFGVVYMGYVGTEKVAVKKLFNTLDFSDNLFLDEIQCLIRAKHKNIVRFLGYCSDTQGGLTKFNGAYVLAEERERLLCFEYVPNGNIQQYLKEKPCGDDWDMRYQMIKGICQGLQYLHEERIGHLDMKPENVMLDSNMEPKITDFGLSRWLDEGKSIVFTANIRGTMGYIAPETITTGEISFKSDIYALGIIIIKLLMRHNNIDFENWHESLGVDCQQMKICIDIARACVDTDKARRPTIGEINDSINETDSSINQASSCAFPQNEKIDAYPLELIFPFQPNEDIACSVVLSNQTDVHVGFIIIPYCEDMFVERWNMNGVVAPMSSRVVTLTLQRQAVLVPLDSEKLLIMMIVMSSDRHVSDIMSKAISNGYCIMHTDDIYKLVAESEGEMHWAMLTAVVREHDPTTKTPMFDEHVEGIESIEVHPTEPWVLVQQNTASIYIWNWRTKDKVYEHPGVRASKFISRNNWLVTGNSEGDVTVYKCPTMERIVTEFKAHDHYITLLAVHPTRPLLFSSGVTVTGGGDKKLKIWDWNKGWRCIQELDITSCLRQLDITNGVRQVMFSPNNPNVFWCHELQYNLKLWTPDYSEHIAETEEIAGIRIGFIFTYSNRPSERHLITAISDRDAQIWDFNEEGRSETLVYTFSFGDLLAALACHPTRPLLLTASFDGHICLWDTMTYRLKKEYTNLRREKPIDIAFIGSRRFAIAYKDGISIMNI